MPNLIFNSLAIRQFRGLRELRIEHLGRANLIVGKNNVGKTTILEALRLYVQPGSSDVLLELLEARDEIDPRASRRINTREARSVIVEGLFYGRRAIPGETAPIQIGPMNSDEKTLFISFDSLRRSSVAESFQQSFLPIDRVDEPSLGIRLGLIFQIGSMKTYLPITNALELSRVQRMGGLRPEDAIKYYIPVCFVSANGLESGQIGELWDSIALTEQEEDVITALRIIAPELERLILIAKEKFSRSRTPVVKIRGYQQSIPLRSMGDGVNRIFGIVLALVNAKDGILLIDEIENGIHYSVQPTLWELILKSAQRLNVQVFATSHSWDCIEAFQRAARDNTEVEGVLVRLDRKGDEVHVVNLDERDLGIAVEGRIEVR